MSVSDDNVTAALTYLAIDPHPLAVAKFEMMKAENNAKRTWARIFLASNQTPNDARKASAEVHPDYIEAKDAETAATFEVERHKERKNAADSLLDIYQTESANARSGGRPL
jgi:hypothetical protein